MPQFGHNFPKHLQMEGLFILFGCFTIVSDFLHAAGTVAFLIPSGSSWWGPIQPKFRWFHLS